MKYCNIKRLLYLLTIILLISCTKEKVEESSSPTQEETEIAQPQNIDTIVIPKDQNSPKNTCGFYGHVLEWTGDFMPGTTNPGTIDSLETELYIYFKLTFDQIQHARTSQYSLFWYIDSIKQRPIHIIKTNNKGFYEICLPPGSYTGLVRYDEHTFYNNGGYGNDGHIGALFASDTLVRRNFDIDFQKSQ